MQIRTFLIRNGLPILFKQGEAAYRTYYLRQMQKWNTSPAKQRALSKMLDEWAVFIRRKYGYKQLPSSTYLSEAEPFLEQYAKRSAQNQALVGAAGSSVRAEDFMAIVDGGDEEGDLEPRIDAIPSSPTPTVKETIRKDEGLIVFFPGRSYARLLQPFL
ncbi:UNVERIFIED_CONTAM: tRNA ligase 1 [Sesamum radiatum]|uniref:tRNA ligase 1 n=1 Tax=Sesamum radiatum TaxID=300843 RepID=A0AAW2W4X6_SESRA